MKSKKFISLLLVISMLASIFVNAVPAFAADDVTEVTQPAAMNIGYPTFKNVELLEEVFDLDKLSVSKAEDDIMMAIYE